MNSDALPAGWQVWHESEARVILAYRPEVFDSEAFPAPCMPTIYVTSGSPRRRARSADSGATTWAVTLFFEPEIEATTDQYDDRETAIDGAIAAAQRLVDGEIEYRDLYQVPREDYFDKLDDLLG